MISYWLSFLININQINYVFKYLTYNLVCLMQSDLTMTNTEATQCEECPYQTNSKTEVQIVIPENQSLVTQNRWKL